MKLPYTTKIEVVNNKLSAFHSEEFTASYEIYILVKTVERIHSKVE
jgi:hypothetical protein